MAKRVNITEEQSASRLVRKAFLAKVDSLPIRINNGNVAFSVFLKPADDEESDIAIVECKLLNDTDTGGYPVVVGKWDEGLFQEISGPPELITDFDVYVATGENF